MDRVSLIRAGVIALGTLPLACGKGRTEAASSPPVAAVEVPSAPVEADGAAAEGPLPARRSDRAPDTEQTPIEVVTEGDSVQFSSSTDAGVRFWGTYTSLDGGFSFKGGFSIGSGPDGGAGP